MSSTISPSIYHPYVVSSESISNNHPSPRYVYSVLYLVIKHHHHIIQSHTCSQRSISLLLQPERVQKVQRPRDTTSHTLSHTYNPSLTLYMCYLLTRTRPHLSAHCLTVLSLSSLLSCQNVIPYNYLISTYLRQMLLLITCLYYTLTVSPPCLRLDECVRTSRPLKSLKNSVKES